MSEFAKEAGRAFGETLRELAESGATPAEVSAAERKARRGTTNTNVRGNTKDRAARRAYLLETYAADVKLVRVYWDADNSSYEEPERGLFHGLRTEEVPTARCYRCGTLLHDGTITADRIIPGCQGGTYRRSNIRPACATCQSTFGGSQRSTK